MALQQLLNDYTALGENEFWLYFMEFVDKKAMEALAELAKESYTEQKLRYWQGAFRALKLVAHEYPAILLKEIKREIDK